jgi:hypothetical protein|tara:strand:+ start:734 stop:919 length:186 start_codon:yes stop_codon:yes gene_type:complete
MITTSKDYIQNDRDFAREIACLKAENATYKQLLKSIQEFIDDGIFIDVHDVYSTIEQTVDL